MPCTDLQAPPATPCNCGKKKKEAEEKTEMFEKSLQTMESSKTKKKNDAEIAGVITLILDKIHYCTARLHITFQQVLTTLKNFI